MSDPRDDRIREALERQHRRIAAHIDTRAGLDRIKEKSPMRRALVPALATALLIAVLVGAVALVSPFGGDDPVAGPSTTLPPTTTIPADSTTTTPPETTTTSPVTTVPAATTTVPVTTTIPPPEELGFVVAGVAADDVLNVRERPDPGATIVGGLAPGARVPTTGLATSDVPGPGWWQVRLADGTEGWVNNRFVASASLSDVGLDVVPCAEPGTTNESEPAVSPGGDASEADHVFALDLADSGPECDRVVIHLGAGTAGGWPESPAARIPDGIEVSVAGPVVVVTFPAGIVTVRPTATERDLGVATAFVVRTPDGPLQVRVHFDRNIAVGASYLPDPARIVLDVAGAPTGTGLDLAPVAGPNTVLRHPVQVDLNGPGVTQPITVSGYARPFEAQGAAVVRTVGAGGPGSGDPVEATFSSVGGQPETATQFSFMTTDYVTTWGSFEFTIDGLAPGEYELFVGEMSAADGSPIGVYDTFTVAG